MESMAKDGGHLCRVCAYARVSTLCGEQLNSFENQVEIYTDKIKSNPEWEFAGVYADPAISGTTGDRPQFKKMMCDAKKHKFDLILVKSISRFARNTLLALQSIRELRQLGIRVIFEKEHIDTGNPESEMMLTIMSAFAQEESRNISERVKKGIQMRAANGDIPWAPMYGYKKEGEKAFVIVEKESEIVRRIYDMYEKNTRPARIAMQLNAEGIRMRSGKEWNRQKVIAILKNERYAGNVLTNKTYTENHLTHKRITNRGEVEQLSLDNHHDAIIPQEQFARVQTIQRLKKERQYPYSDMLICPYCRKSLNLAVGLPNTSLKSWVCDEDRFYMPTNQLDAAVLQACSLFLHGSGSTLGAEEMEGITSVEYWWLDKLATNISFGFHETTSDQTVTVHWKSGESTTVPSGVKMGILRNKRMRWLNKQRNR